MLDGGGPISKGLFDHIFQREKLRNRNRRKQVAPERPASEYDAKQPKAASSADNGLLRRIWRWLRG